MVLSPVIKLNVTIPGASSYPADASLLSPMINLPYEPEAAGHWFFGSDNPSNLDLVADQPLTRALFGSASGGTGYPVSSKVALVFSGGTGSGAAGFAITNGSGVPTAIVITSHGSYTVAPTATISTAGGGSGATVTITLALAPTVGAGALTLGSGFNGLVTPFTVSANVTVMAVFQRHGSGTPAIIIDEGSQIGRNFNANLYVTSTGAVYTVQTNGSSASVAAPAGAATGDSIFVGLSHSSVSGRVLQWGGGSAYTSSTPMALDAPALPQIGIGNPNFGNSAGYSFPTTLNSLIVIPRGLSAAEMLAVYSREKARLADRGVTVF